MRTKKILPYIVLAIAMVWTGCEKDYNYVVPKTKKINNGGGGGPVDTVYYKNTIEPFWNTYGCAVSGCHNGTLTLDLRVGSSYASLHDVGSIDTGTPESSDLYRRITLPSSDVDFMPEGASPMSDADAEKVLNWIKQGAKNN